MPASQNSPQTFRIKIFITNCGSQMFTHLQNDCGKFLLMWQPHLTTICSIDNCNAF